MKIKSSYRATYNLAIRVSKKIAKASLLTVGVYVLLPTPDGLFIHPFFGSLFSHISGMSFKQGIVISIATYTSIGIVFCLIGGGKQIFQKLKIKFTRRPKRYRIICRIRKRLLNFKYSPPNDTTYSCSP